MQLEFKEIMQNYPLTLLLDADPDIKKIEKYLNKGHCYGAYNDDGLVGEYVLKNQKNGIMEIMNLAVSPKHRKKGIARLMIMDAVERARAEGFKLLEIATGKDSFQHTFYESCGFEIYETDEGYFTRMYEEPIIDNGVQCIDLVKLRMTL